MSSFSLCDALFSLRTGKWHTFLLKLGVYLPHLFYYELHSAAFLI
jgi:hypothetical protein